MDGTFGDNESTRARREVEQFDGDDDKIIEFTAHLNTEKEKVAHEDVATDHYEIEDKELYESGSEDNDDDDDEDDDGGDDSSSSEHVSSEHASYTVEEEV